MERSPKYTAALHAIRDEIKRLASNQKKLKQLRKPDVTVPAELAEELGLDRWMTPDQKIATNRGKITARLNTYLAARGKEYRHGVNPRSAPTYLAEMERLQQAYPELVSAAV